MSTPAVERCPVAAGTDFTDPDLIQARVPMPEFAWLRENQPMYWNPQTREETGYDDGGLWIATRHADVLFRFAEGVPASLHIRAFDHRCLRGILEGHDLLRTRQRRQSEKHAQQQCLADKIHAFRSFSIDSVRSIFYKQMLILDYISL